MRYNLELNQDDLLVALSILRVEHNRIDEALNVYSSSYSRDELDSLAVRYRGLTNTLVNLGLALIDMRIQNGEGKE